jgi:aspartate kinase
MLSVLKIGGSVLRNDASYAATARFLQTRLAGDEDEKLVVIVSAQHGRTDALLAEALLTLHLQALGVAAVPFNVHQTGLVACPEPRRGACADRIAGTTVRPLRLLAALASSRLVIVPGFLGVSPGGTITSLGRGGSDLTAVLLAAAVRADACELIKDVPGYFTADPHRDAGARPIHDLTIAEALAMADAGCDLVQRAALAAAAAAQLHIVIRSLDAAAPVTHLRSQHHGIRHQDDSRRAAVGA